MTSFRESYDKELEGLRESLVEMCSQVEITFEKLFIAMERRTVSEIQILMETEDVFNDMERDIESKCMSLITRQQPIASDLRQITTAIKVAGDLEREGTHVIDIAELVLRLKATDLNQFSVHIYGMVKVTMEMLHSSVEAFINEDCVQAQEVIKSDDVVDMLFNKVKTDIVAFLKAESKDMDECVDVLMIAKYLEKMGDHATNIGEWTIFQKTGKLKNERLI